MTDILVDSSVWIDWFADRTTLQTVALDELFRRRERLLVGDLVLAEVLQGARDRAMFDRLLAGLREFDGIGISDHRVAIEAARFYRSLRVRGITVRKAIDTLIATRCLMDDIALLYADRDFDPFVQHLGLRPAMTQPGAS